MLMAWGPFRFTVPTYSVEALQRSVQPRLDEAPIIQAMPSIHRLGPGNPTISLQSTFHPHHLNGRGLAQLSAVREAVNAMSAYSLATLGGDVFGSWIGTGVEDQHELFDVAGTPGIVQVTLDLKANSSLARQIATGLMARISISLF